MSLRDEIFEQPEVMRRLLASQTGAVGEIADAIRRRAPASIVIAARGSSDNAALYAKYLWGSWIGLPVALATPSLFTIYGAPPRLERSLVVGISQSGQSPDIVSVLEEGRAQGALTLAITNETSSPLAAAAQLVLDTAAGPERAVAATKTYTAQLMAVAMVGAQVRADAAAIADLGRVPELVAEALEQDAAIEVAAQRYRYMDRCVVLGRGFNYATAYEWSLKIKEMTYVVAEPYSSADFQHGPVAVVSDGFPLLAAAPQGQVLDHVLSLLDSLVAEQRAEVLMLSNSQRSLDLAAVAIPLPEMPEWLSPLVTIVPAQLFCRHLTEAKGYDTESPRRLSKVTRTW